MANATIENLSVMPGCRNRRALARLQTNARANPAQSFPIAGARRDFPCTANRLLPRPSFESPFRGPACSVRDSAADVRTNTPCRPRQIASRPSRRAPRGATRHQGDCAPSECICRDAVHTALANSANAPASQHAPSQCRLLP